MDAKVNEKSDDKGAGECPVMHGRGARTNRDWWPGQLSLQGLNQHAPQPNPLGAGFDSRRNSSRFGRGDQDLHAR
jgi:catalase-peroxidase